MSLRVRFGTLTLVAVLAAAAGLAAAQDSTDDSSTSDDSSTDGASTEVVRRTDLTPQEEIAEAQRLLANGQSLSMRVQGMLDQARRESDVLRVTCLDDKLTQINAHVRTLGDRVGSLEDAVGLNDSDRTNHEYTVITVLGQNLTQLDRAASECVGQDMYETGTTRVVTTIEPGTPTVNAATLSPMGTEGVPFIPAPMSGSM